MIRGDGPYSLGDARRISLGPRGCPTRTEQMGADPIAFLASRQIKTLERDPEWTAADAGGKGKENYPMRK